MRVAAKIIGLAIGALSIGVACAAPTTFETTRAAALRGDYQAQRNLAYGYVSSPYPGQAKDPVLGCSWYLVVLHSGDSQVDTGDVGNVEPYCQRRLDATQQTEARTQARALFQKVYKQKPAF